MDVIVSHGVALCRRPQLTSLPEINLSPSSLWKTGFGGLNRRFKGNFYKDVRLTDPWAGEFLRFRTQLHADNWLLRAFDPSCRSYALASGPMRVLNRGQFLSVQFFAMGKSLDGKTFADLVLKKETRRTEATWEQFQIAARAHGVIPVKRRLEDINANLTLLENLEEMRSHLVRHLASLQLAIRITPHILNELTQQAFNVADLARRLNARGLETSEEGFHYALFRAYRRGELNLDVASVRYGRRTTVSLRKEA